MLSSMKSKPSEYGDEKQNLIRYFESRVQRWYKVYFLELILRQKPLPPSKHGRRISLRPVHEEPLIDERTGRGYVSNTIRSSRYTIFDFLPKQFIFQATRLSNFYFICIGIPQAIPGLSTTGSYTTILPLLFFILLTIAKEGYDDFRRHRLDKVENRQLALVLKQSVPTSSTNVACTDSSSRSFSWSYKWPLKHVEEYSSVEVDDSGLRWAKVSWQDIKVGDIIRLRRDDAIPADVVLLYSSGENGIAYVETMAIDGETNLKIRQAPEALKTCASIDGLQSCPATFVMEDPNSDLYSFIGKVAINEEADISLSLNEIILRGSIVRNTEFVIGMAINTGEECKIRMNANHHPKAKKPRLEKFANQIVLTLVFYVIVLTAGCSAGYVLWQRSTGRNSFYLDDSPVDMKEIIIGFAIEFNNVIPLALYVSLEIVKIVQMFLISNDIEMYDEASNTPMVCNTNTILENLGQVTHILSDKTGTLTENVMEFRRMSISGYSWTDKEETGAYPGSYSAMDLMKYVNAHPSHWLSKRTREFVLGMALCNTCLPERNEGEKIKFQASSPDEVALVQAAQDLGYQLVNRSSRYITLEINLSNENSVQEVYEVLDVIEFSSYRKRMSIILRNRDGRIWLLCKGADSVIIPRLQSSTLAEEAREVIRESFEVERQQLRSEHTLERSSIGGRMSLNAARPSLSVGRVSLSGEIGHVASTIVSNGHGGDGQRSLKHPDELISIPVLAENSVFGDIKSIPMLGDTQTFTNCFKHLHEFATEGLRTLLFAQRYIPEDEYLTWKQIYNKASTVLIDRQEQIETAAELIEQSLELLGASAIEDKLQTGVNETVEKLQRANISIWMLTGDKRETAMNIAHSAGIFKPHSDLYVLDSTKGNLEDQLQKWRDDLKPNGGHSLAVIDGDTLAHIEVNLSLKAAFYSLIPSFNSVVCCRASPAQKANIVMAIKSRVPGALTLAIGDGANDIAMIQASHVGVGISGREGLQAARVADYSIAQFRFLQRLLLVHGRWNYVRTAKFVLMTFWKEMFFYMMQILYQQYNGFTGTSLYENWSLTVLNTFFTSLCVIIMGTYEQDLSAKTLLAVPELYVYGQRNMGLNLRKYSGWMIAAVSEGVIVWLVCWAAYGLHDSTGDEGIFAFGDLVFSAAMMWTNFKLFIIETHSKTSVVFVNFSITIAGWWTWNLLLALVYARSAGPYAVRDGFTKTFGGDPIWWLTLVIVFAILLVIQLTYKVCKRGCIRLRLWPLGNFGQISKEDFDEWNVNRWQELEQIQKVKGEL